MTKTFTPVDQSYKVQFTGDYFSLVTNVVISATVDETDEELFARAENEAISLIRSYYGWDMEDVSHDISVERVTY